MFRDFLLVVAGAAGSWIPSYLISLLHDYRRQLREDRLALHQCFNLLEENARISLVIESEANFAVDNAVKENAARVRVLAAQVQCKKFSRITAMLLHYGRTEEVSEDATHALRHLTLRAIAPNATERLAELDRRRASRS